MLSVVPTAEPDAWIAKQNLLTEGKPTVAGLLLFADEPQAALPKRSAIKLFRYMTKDTEGSRESLAFDPLTIEGPLDEQIRVAVAKTKELVEGINRLGATGLEYDNISARNAPRDHYECGTTQGLQHRRRRSSTDIR